MFLKDIEFFEISFSKLLHVAVTIFNFTLCTITIPFCVYTGDAFDQRLSDANEIITGEEEKNENEDIYVEKYVDDDGDDVDYEDEDEEFFFSSKEEDELLRSFVEWLTSVDGGSKGVRQANKFKSTIMQIVRSGDDEVDYRNLYSRDFLNK